MNKNAVWATICTVIMMIYLGCGLISLIKAPPAPCKVVLFTTPQQIPITPDIKMDLKGFEICGENVSPITDFKF